MYGSLEGTMYGSLEGTMYGVGEATPSLSPHLL